MKNEFHTHNRKIALYLSFENDFGVDPEILTTYFILFRYLNEIILQ